VKRKTIIIIVSIAVLMLSGSVFYRYYAKKPLVYYWRTVVVERGDVNVLVTSTGTVNADTSVDVGVQVSGKIARILVDFNSIVKKGQVIAVLDTTLLYASKVDAAAVKQRALQQLALSKEQYLRARSLFDSSVTARADYEPILTAYQTANGIVTSANAELNKAKINLQYATIKSPINGVVISRNIQIGNMVIASFNSPTLFTIANDLHQMQVQANVDEADIGQVKPGQSVKFTVDAFPNDIFEGEVTQVRHQAVVVTNVVNYVVIISVENLELKLMPGLTANLNIYIDERKNVLRVPSNAFSFTPPVEYIRLDKLLSDTTRKKWEMKIQKSGEVKKQEIVESVLTKGNVWIKSGEDVRPVELTRGLSDGAFTEVTGAVEEGDEVVVGINQSASSSEAGKTQSPFMPKFPSRKKK
jgi:HlyD family secretion protein